MNLNSRLFTGAILLTLGFLNLGYAQDVYQVLPIAPQFDIKQVIKEPEVNNDAKKAASVLRSRTSKQTAEVREIFRTGQINPRFRAYFLQVVVPQFTRYDRESLQTLTERREKIVLDFYRSIKNNTIRGFLITEVFFPEMKKIVVGPFHPAVRYNAMLLIGELDEVSGKNNAVVPRPYRQSITFLLEQYAALADPKLAYLKYGAFKGMSRIAGIDSQLPAGFLQAGDRNQVKAIFRSLLNGKPADLSADLFTAMQRQAVEVMGNYGEAADADAFAKLIDDPTTPVWTKLEAAVAFSKIKTPDANRVNAQAAKAVAVSTSIGKFMHDVLRTEVTNLDYHQKRIAVLAARRGEIGAVGIVGKKGKSSGAKRSGPSSGGSGSSAPSSGSGSGAGAGVGGGSGAGVGSGGGAGGAGAGAGAGNGTSGGRGSEPVILGELPAYRIKVSRRRIKTITTGLLAALGSPDDSTVGIMRWGQANIAKIGKLKEFVDDADMVAESGMGDSALIANITDHLKEEYTKVADQLASELGIALPTEKPAVAEGKTAEPAAPTKKPDDGFGN